MRAKDDCMCNLCHGDYNYVPFALVLFPLLPLSYNHHLILCEGQGYSFHLAACVRDGESTLIPSSFVNTLDFCDQLAFSSLGQSASMSRETKTSCLIVVLAILFEHDACAALFLSSNHC